MSSKNIKTAEIPFEHLPHGAGSAIGNFIRAIYMTSSSRPSIIGCSVTDLSGTVEYGLMESLPNDSVTVADIVLGIIGEEYTIKPGILTSSNNVGKSDLGDVYKFTVKIENTDVLTTDAFSSCMVTKQRTIAAFLQQPTILITLYIMEVRGVMKESIASACLQEVLTDSGKVIPLACSGNRSLKCWHRITKNTYTEDVVIHLEGDSRTFDEDLRFFKELIGRNLNDIASTLSS